MRRGWDGGRDGAQVGKRSARRARGGRPTPARALLVASVVWATWAGGIASVRRSDLAAVDPARPRPAPRGDILHAWRELDARRRDLYVARDPTLVPLVFAPGATADRVAGEITALIRADVRASTTFSTRALTVVRVRANRAVLRQTVALEPRFVDAAGNDVTFNAGRRIDVIDWRLRRIAGEWRIAHGTVVSSGREGL